MQTECIIWILVLEKRAHLQMPVCLTARLACTLLPSMGLCMTDFKMSIKKATSRLKA